MVFGPGSTGVKAELCFTITDMLDDVIRSHNQLSSEHSCSSKPKTQCSHPLKCSTLRHSFCRIFGTSYEVSLDTCPILLYSDDSSLVPYCSLPCPSIGLSQVRSNICGLKTDSSVHNSTIYQGKYRLLPNKLCPL